MPSSNSQRLYAEDLFQRELALGPALKEEDGWKLLGNPFL